MIPGLQHGRQELCLMHHCGPPNIFIFMETEPKKECWYTKHIEIYTIWNPFIFWKILLRRICISPTFSLFWSQWQGTIKNILKTLKNIWKFFGNLLKIILEIKTDIHIYVLIKIIKDNKTPYFNIIPHFMKYMAFPKIKLQIIRKQKLFYTV